MCSLSGALKLRIVKQDEKETIISFENIMIISETILIYIVQIKVLYLVLKIIYKEIISIC